MNKEKRYSKIEIILWIIFIVSILYILGYYLLDMLDSSSVNDIRELKEKSINNIIDNNIDDNIIVQNESENIIENSIENNIVKNNYNNSEDSQIISNLKNEYTNLIGWILIPGTNIDYPIMQADDNDYYLKRGYDDKYNMNGSIFLDYRVDFSSNLFNAIIYGHNNQNDKMFENLLKYSDEDFYKENSKIIITTQNLTEEYEIFSVFKSKQYEKSKKDVFKYYNVIDLSSEELFNDYIKNVIDLSLYNTNIIPEFGDKIITLSTCEYTNENGRFVVVARMIKE